MQALLLSPATRFSPDSSSSLSPATPPLPSLDFLSFDTSSTTQTPTHPRRTRTTPPPTTSTVQDDDNKTPSPPSVQVSPPSWLNQAFPLLPSQQQQHQPRIPSTLRHAHTVSSSSSTVSTPSFLNDNDDETLQREESRQEVEEPQGNNSIQLINFDEEEDVSQRRQQDYDRESTSFQRQHETFSKANESTGNVSSSTAVSQRGGTFVCNSVVVNSQRGGGGGDENDQLQAAVRAFKGGPQAGWFGPDDSQSSADGGRGDGEVDEGGDQGKKKLQEVGRKVKKGLLSLFEPPSPPSIVPLPKSTQPAPSLSTFSFSPPTNAPSLVSPPSNISTTSSTTRTARGHRSSDDDRRRSGGQYQEDVDLTPIASTKNRFNTNVETTTTTTTPQLGQSWNGRQQNEEVQGVGKRNRFLHRSTTTTINPPPSARSPSPPPRDPIDDSRRSTMSTTTRGGEEDDDETTGQYESAQSFYPPPLPHHHHPPSSYRHPNDDDEDTTETESEEEENRHRIGIVGGFQVRSGHYQAEETDSSSEDESSEEDNGRGRAGVVEENGEEEEGFGPLSMQMSSVGDLRADGHGEGEGVEKGWMSSEEEEEEEVGTRQEQQYGPESRNDSPIEVALQAEGNSTDGGRRSLTFAQESGQDVLHHHRKEEISYASSSSPQYSEHHSRRPSSSTPTGNYHVYSNDPPQSSPRLDPSNLPTLNLEPTSPSTPFAVENEDNQSQPPLQPPPASPLRLFQPSYDTYTRNHLAQIVDLVDDDPTEQEEFTQVETSEEGFMGMEGRLRSCKRIKLSPPSNSVHTTKGNGSGWESSPEQDGRRGGGMEGQSTILEEEEGEEEDESYGTPITSRTGRPSTMASRRRWTPTRSSERKRRTARDRRLTTTSRSSARRRYTDRSTTTRMGSFIGESPSRTTGSTNLVGSPLQSSVRGDGGEERGGDDEERKLRVRDRMQEATELMDKIRKRTEEREARKNGSSTGESSKTNSLGSTLDLRSLRSSRLLSPVPPSTSNDDSSSPPLPHLAAAASASIRSVLGSPAPISQASPRPLLARSNVTPAASNKIVNLGVSQRLPASLAQNLEKNGSIGRRSFAKVPVDLATVNDNDNPSTTNPPSIATNDGPALTPKPVHNHKRQSSLTTIHPSSLDAQRLLASVGHSAQAKGMVFDDKLGRWIRQPRQRIVSRGSSSDRVEETVVEDPELEIDEEDEEDPFKDFSELQSPPNPSTRELVNGTLRSSPNTHLAADLPPPSPANRVDLDRLPLPGDGSGSLKLPHNFNLSGLGISKGTPPLLAPPEKDNVVEKSPESACYFDAPPPEDRLEQEGSLLELEEEEEDSATWGQEEKRDEDDEVEVPAQASTAIPDANRSPRRRSLPATTQQMSSPATPAHTQQSHSAPPSTSTPFPRSVLKPTRTQTDPTGYASTPVRSASSEPPKIPRSVSFSDGKTSGKIENLTAWKGFGSKLKFEVSALSGSSGTVTSELEGAFGELELDAGVAESNGSKEEVASEEAEADHATDDTPRPHRVKPTHDEASETSVVLSSFDSASPAQHRSANSSRSRTFSRTTNSRNATFLTECSFGVSHDRLLQFITDVEPFEPDWENLKSIDLSGKKAESVVRMKEFLPRLDEVNLNNNEIAYLTGIPATLRTLLIASNRLTSMSSFHHLANLERLDLSNNELDSVLQLSSLRHLRDLKLDGNQITTIEGLEHLDGLVRLSLKSNRLEGEIDLERTKWSRLETLHLARNRINGLRGLEQLESLTSLNMDHNALSALDPARPMSRLRILRLCNNPIAHLDVSFAPKLRTLYVDTARLGVMQGTEHLRKLENLSVRDQAGEALTLAMPHIRDVKRLYLSGNPLPSSFPSEKFFNLTYLELAMCKLTSLPSNLASLVPNVRTLNLDYNFLESIEPLSGLSRLGKLSIVGARLTKVRPVIGVLDSLVELESLDLRMNPITLAFYPPLGPSNDSLLPTHFEHRIVHPDSFPSNSPSTTAPDFSAIDSKFRKALPDEWYFKRSAYRAAVMHSTPTLIKLDGIDCQRERKKVLRKVVDKLNHRS